MLSTRQETLSTGHPGMDSLTVITTNLNTTTPTVVLSFTLTEVECATAALQAVTQEF